MRACTMAAIVTLFRRASGSGVETLQMKAATESSAVKMMFWSPPPVSKNTRLAKEPALDKCKSEEEWKAQLRPTTFEVLRHKATEPSGVRKSNGGFDDLFDKGTYICAGCRTPLYESDHKFDCGCGWPGFWTNVKDAVYEKNDADGWRSELICSSCGGYPVLMWNEQNRVGCRHIGHVFRGEGFRNPEPNERHCVNSCSLAFVPEGKVDGPDTVECTYSGRVYGGTR